MRFVLTAGVLLALALTLEAAELKIGEPFPDLAFPAADGGAPTSISDFRGQKLVLHVFASW